VASIEKQGGHVVRDAKGNIVEVSLARTWATDADVEKLAGLKTLKKLDLSLTYVSDVGAQTIGGLPQLEELNLFTAEFITDAAVASLRSNTNLRVLNLRGTDVTDTSVEYISQLGNLRSLDISYTQIGDVGMDHLAPLSQLEELNVGGTKISGAALHVLKYLPSLKRLSFYGTQRRNAGVCWAPVMTDLELDTIALLTGLEELNIGDGVALGEPKPAALGPATGEAECRIIGGTRITDFGVAKLATLKKLRYLNLSGSAVTGGALQTLAALPTLQRLSLWNAASINDSAASGFESLRSVTSLDLSNTGIGDRTLAALAKLPHLQRLYVSDTAVTKNGIAAFAQQRPSTVVSWGVRPEPREPLVGSTKPRGAYTE
jgi:Leucine-rich repeat (LRR) protein